MKFALVNGQRNEAQKGLRGICVNCQSDMVAKCGQVKVSHWAHKSKKSCDPWWENETEWHRTWKNHFPKEWQEKIHIDATTGEKHIADIKTDQELIIEFQHSTIEPSEVQSREEFYKKMVWVVDGTRRKGDYSRFRKGFCSLRSSKIPGIFLSLLPGKCFHASWINRSVPVYFDFQDRNAANQQDELRSVLWCLFPGRPGGFAVVAGVPREDFVKFSSKDSHLIFAHEMLSNISQAFQPQRAEEEKRKYPQVAPYRQQHARNPGYRRYRL
jgi:hypothetical protein